MKLGLIIAMAAGAAVGIWVIHAIGFGAVMDAVAATGWLGFIAYCVFTLGVLVLLGAAWMVVSPNPSAGRLPLYAWARLVRESAADLLPFTQVGGVVYGVRTIIAAERADEPRVLAGTLVDLVTEMVAQLIYTLAGLLVLVWSLSGGGNRRALDLAGLGLAASAVVTVGFAIAQPAMIRIGGRLASRWMPDGEQRAQAVELALKALYAQPLRIALAVALHLAAWIASGLGAWMVLRLAGIDAPLWAVLTIESLLYAVRSAAFLVPNALGVQEGAYVLLAPLFAITPEAALGLSLVKRARDIAIGLPALVIWHGLAGRRLSAIALRDRP